MLRDLAVDPRAQIAVNVFELVCAFVYDLNPIITSQLCCNLTEVCTFSNAIDPPRVKTFAVEPLCPVSLVVVTFKLSLNEVSSVDCSPDTPIDLAVTARPVEFFDNRVWDAASMLGNAKSSNPACSREPAGRSLPIEFKSYRRAETVFGDGRAVF